MNFNFETTKIPIIKKLLKDKVLWLNPNYSDFNQAIKSSSLTMEDIDDAENRLLRFAPFICKYFPETLPHNGMIESELKPIENMKNILNHKFSADLKGCLLLKQDSHLAIAGSIKARGGIYEILKYSEELALEHNLISYNDNYEKFAEKNIKDFFSQYSIHVGSTGNLGLSIGIISAAIGYHVTVHMSTDAKQWKKDLLRSKGVAVNEYNSDYSEAVRKGRLRADKNPKSYFVDDENSTSLFLGYAVAAKRLFQQLNSLGIVVDKEHPLFVYLPCGVGGAPGGVTFGLKQIFKDNVHCFFVEPEQAPCMLLGMATGLQNKICVQDIGLTGITCADGLAVGRPSKFVGKTISQYLSGIFTVDDKILYDYMRMLLDSENIFIEPSACAAFEGVLKMNFYSESNEYIKKHNLTEKMNNACHIAWATGGSLVPDAIRNEYKNTFID